MPGKQKEMDLVVQQIYSAIETQDYLQDGLLVLLGDHGMTDAGNHGGSTPGETSPAFVLISPKLRAVSAGMECPTLASRDYSFYSVVQQSDITPTLAGLLGFPIPQNSLGVFIPQLLPLFQDGKTMIPVSLL